MIIGVTGYGATGASACMDLIREFEDMQYYEPHFEFQLLQQPDGIADLRYNLVESRRRISINTAICRFIKRYEFSRSDLLSIPTNGQYKSLSQKYVDSIVQMRWPGKSGFDPEDLLSKFEDRKYRYITGIIKRIVWLFKPDSTWPPDRTRYFTCISEDEFVEKTRKYLNDIFLASGFDLNKPILLEQLFCLERPTEGGEFFDDFRTIIVDRDPRDVYTLTNGYLTGPITSFMPNTGDVKAFVDYYCGLHHAVSKDSRVFYLQYEDLIYRYDDTVNKLQEFLGLKHMSPKAKFKPEWSISNTKTFNKYPELAEDIHYIEEKLAKYLYPFERYEENLPFVSEGVGIFDNKPGDKRGFIHRSQKVLKHRDKR